MSECCAKELGTKDLNLLLCESDCLHDICDEAVGLHSLIDDLLLGQILTQVLKQPANVLSERLSLNLELIKAAALVTLYGSLPDRTEDLIHQVLVLVYERLSP